MADVPDGVLPDHAALERLRRRHQRQDLRRRQAPVPHPAPPSTLARGMCSAMTDYANPGS